MTLESKIDALLTAVVIQRAITLRRAREETDGPEFAPPVHTFIPVAVTEIADFKDEVMALLAKNR